MRVPLTAYGSGASRFRVAAPDPRAVRAALAVAAAYYLGAKLGFAFTFEPTPVSMLWLPNSLLLTGLLLAPVSWWWLLLAAALPAHVAAELQGGVPLAMVLGWFASNCSEALIGAVCIRRFVAGPLRFDSFRDVGIFLAFGACIAPLLSSFLDVALVTAIGWGEGSYWELVHQRSLSNALAAMLVVPLVMTWAANRSASALQALARRAFEAGLLLFGLFVVGVVTFDLPEAGPSTVPALLYAPLPFVLWAALRFGPVGTSTALFIVVMLAIWGTVHDHGPFVIRSPEENASAVQLFLIAMAVPVLLLAAAVEERRKAKEALQLSEQRLASAFRYGPDPMIMLRLSDGAVVDVNGRWEALFGYTREEAIGRTPAELRLNANDAQWSAGVERLKASGRIRDFAIELRDRAGAVHPTVLSAETFKAGDVPCLVATLRDITAQRRAEGEAREQRTQLTHLTRVAMLGQMSGALAHELNQPLTAILSNAQAAQHFLASDRFDADELREILKDIVTEDQRADMVIRRLRALFTRGEAELQVLDANDLVREALELVHGQLLARNIDTVLELSPRLPAVECDRVQMHQVLLNLLLNASEAMSAGEPGARALTVGTRASSAGSVQISVADAGPGIASEALPKVFEPFFTTKPNGLGLGLSISRSIIAAHGGRLWCDNNVGRGATFHVLLPAHARTLP